MFETVLIYVTPYDQTIVVNNTNWLFVNQYTADYIYDCLIQHSWGCANILASDSQKMKIINSQKGTKFTLLSKGNRLLNSILKL